MNIKQNVCSDASGAVQNSVSKMPAYDAAWLGSKLNGNSVRRWRHRPGCSGQGLASNAVADTPEISFYGEGLACLQPNMGQFRQNNFPAFKKQKQRPLIPSVNVRRQRDFRERAFLWSATVRGMAWVKPE